MRAYNALQEALRRRREDWRLWENMVVRTRAIVVRREPLPSRSIHHPRVSFVRWAACLAWMQFVAMGTKHYATAVHAMQVGRALNGPALPSPLGHVASGRSRRASHLHSLGGKRMRA